MSSNPPPSWLRDVLGDSSTPRRSARLRASTSDASASHDVMEDVSYHSLNDADDIADLDEDGDDDFHGM